jgi:hypothetical protein
MSHPPVTAGIIPQTTAIRIAPFDTAKKYSVTEENVYILNSLFHI